MPGIFADELRTVYGDACCHLTPLGKQLLAEQVAAVLRAEQQRSQAAAATRVGVIAEDPAAGQRDGSYGACDIQTAAHVVRVVALDDRRRAALVGIYLIPPAVEQQHLAIAEVLEQRFEGRTGVC